MRVSSLTHTAEGWSGVRVSYGLCGILLADADVPAVADYLEQHQAGACAHTHTHTHARTHANTHARTHTHARTRTRTHTHTHTL